LSKRQFLLSLLRVISICKPHKKETRADVRQRFGASVKPAEFARCASIETHKKTDFADNYKKK